ncbi:hypothetical protein OY671_009859, partial [Metschnikowia pulcherrima]
IDSGETGNGDGGPNGADIGRRERTKSRAGAGTACQPVLHVGLHHSNQQHAAAAPAQRVRPRLHADHADRVRLVHRILRRLDPGGQADRAGRLPARPGGGAGHHGAGHARHDPGRPPSLLRDHA